MPHYFLRVIAPRTTFDQDATEAELAKMHEHFEYWLDLAKRGTAIVFGPVFDKEGIFGMGVVETDDEARAQTIAADDPAARAGVVRISVSAMRVGAIRGA